MRAQCAPEANTARAAASSIMPATAASLTETLSGTATQARAQNPEQQQRELEAVVHEHRDAIAVPEPLGRKPVGDLRAVVLELRPREPPALLDDAVRAARHLPWRAISSGSSGAGAWNQLTDRSRQK